MGTRKRTKSIEFDGRGSDRTTVIGAVISIVVSVGLSTAVSTGFGSYDWQTLFTASVLNPLLIAPPIIYTLLRLISNLHQANHGLQSALDEVDELSGLLPICSSCKKIRDDKGYWNQIETYIKNRSSVEFSHSICPDCKEGFYGHPKKDKGH